MTFASKILFRIRDRTKNQVSTQKNKRKLLFLTENICVAFGLGVTKIFTDFTISSHQGTLTLENFVDTMRKLLNKERIFHRTHDNSSQKHFTLSKSICQIVDRKKDYQSIIGIHLNDDTRTIDFVFGFEM